MSPMVLILCIIVASLLLGLYAKATAQLGEPGKTILDCVIVLVLCLLLFWRGGPIVIERSEMRPMLPDATTIGAG